MARATSPTALLLSAMIGLAAAFTPAVAASPPLLQIEVFTTAEHPVSPATIPGASIRIYRLDAAGDIAAELGRDLPADPVKAAEVARHRLAAARVNIEARARDALAGLQRAAGLGVSHYPAIVFNGRQIVYGERDLAAALVLWQAGQPKVTQ